MSEILRHIVSQNRNGHAVAIPSVCSAHPDVISASLGLAAKQERAIVIEATSNQVNQEGGYTGMRPRDFVEMVHELADTAGLPRNQIIFGGDHLGPQAWRHLTADEAMQNAHVMVAEYVSAGFTKIHLDCSEGCQGEAAALPDEITAKRSAELAATCLDAAANANSLTFVIGTEVPPPGGARADEQGDIPATTEQSAAATLQAHEAAFEAANIGHAFGQVVGLVVQPGVEFSPLSVHPYPKNRKLPFRKVLESWPGICVEAHSTDYQEPDVFPKLAAEGFAFQKVGPVLTFAWRQAIYKLDMIRRLQGHTGETVYDTMHQLMLDEPEKWQGHYPPEAAELSLALHFGLADRIRYYWPHPKAEAAVQDLMDSLAANPPADPLLWQFFSAETVANARQSNLPLTRALIAAEVQAALAPYLFEAS